MAEFLGDGNRHNVTTSGDSWWYSYSSASDRGYWYRGETGQRRFAFGYGDGLWYHLDLYGAAYSLGATAASFDSFVGSGDQYAVTLGGCDWQYQYNYTTDKGLFYAVGPNVDHVRFAYGYGPGQWYHGEGLAFGRFRLVAGRVHRGRRPPRHQPAGRRPVVLQLR